MWKKWKEWLSAKVDVKVTGDICVGIFALTGIGLIVLVVMSVRAEGELPEWTAAAGVGIILVNAWNILLARWGQAQTGRKLNRNKMAVILSGSMIGLMVFIYMVGIFA